MIRRQFLALLLTGSIVAYAKGYVDPVGWHRHKCNKDGFIWTHQPGGDHHCPLCKVNTQYVHYTGPDGPSSLPQKVVTPTWSH